MKLIITDQLSFSLFSSGSTRTTRIVAIEQELATDSRWAHLKIPASNKLSLTWAEFEQLETLLVAIKKEQTLDQKSTPLHSAARLNIPVDHPFFRILCPYDVWVLDNLGKTAWDVAVASNLLGRFSASAQALLPAMSEYLAEMMDENLEFAQEVLYSSLLSEKSLTRDSKVGSCWRKAAEKNDLKIVKWLFAKGAMTYREGDNDYTPLMLVAWRGCLPAVQYLVEQGASIDAKNNDGDTALHLSASGHLPVVQYLVEHGASIDAKGKWDCTALMQAARCACLPVVQYLVEHGASIGAKGKWGYTALIWAAWGFEPLPVIQYLVEHGASIDAKDEWGYTALLRAASHGFFPAVQYLVEQGASIDEKSYGGDTIFTMGMMRFHRAKFPVLKAIALAKSQSLVSQDKQPAVTPSPQSLPATTDTITVPVENISLHTAAQWGDLELVQALLEKSIPVDEKNNTGNTALHLAAANGHLPVVQHLLKNGASVDEKDNYGYTALLWAAANGHLDVVEYLLKHGANIDATTNDGCTIFDMPKMQELSEAELSELKAIYHAISQSAVPVNKKSKAIPTLQLLPAKIKTAAALSEDIPPIDAELEQARLALPVASKALQTTESLPLPTTDEEALYESAEEDELQLPATSSANTISAVPKPNAADHKESLTLADIARVTTPVSDEEKEDKQAETAIADADAQFARDIEPEVIALSTAMAEQMTSPSLSQEQLMALSKQVFLMKQKMMSIPSAQLTPKSIEVLERLSQDDLWLTLERIGKSMQHQEKEFAFLRRHPVLLQTCLTMIAILSHQILSAKIFQSHILKLKTRNTHYRDLIPKLLDTASTHSKEIANILSIPFISGAVTGLLKLYDKHSNDQKRKSLKPLEDYTPSIDDQDHFIKELTFLTIARFHGLLLSADAVDSVNLHDNLSNRLFKALDVSKLKQQFNQLLQRDVFVESKPHQAPLGTVLGEYFADKWMEILISEKPADEDLAKVGIGQENAQWTPIIHAWLDSSAWKTSMLSIAGEKIDLEKTAFAQIIHLQHPNIWWGETSMTVTQAINLSGVKCYHSTDGWIYRSLPHHEVPYQTTGHLYEVNPSVFHDKYALMPLTSPVLSSSAKQAAIDDAEMHYSGVKKISAPIPTAIVLIEDTSHSDLLTSSRSGSNSPVASLDSSASAQQFALYKQEMLSFVAEQLAMQEARLKAEHAAEFEAFKASVAAEHAAKIKALETRVAKQETEISVRPTQAEFDTIAQKTEKAEKAAGRVRYIHPSVFMSEEAVSEGDGPMTLTERELEFPGPKVTAHLEKVNEFGRIIAEQQEILRAQQAELSGLRFNYEVLLRSQRNSLLGSRMTFHATPREIKSGSTSPVVATGLPAPR
jgi:ankyrin repeat protein